MRRTLLSTPRLAVTVRRYGAHERHPRHTDRHSRVSFVLRGGFCEEARAGALRLGPGEVLLKSRRAGHEDRFSDAGATLLALEFLDEDPFALSCAEPWGKRADANSLRLSAAMLDAALAGDADAAAAAGRDLVAAGTEQERSRPPAWLAHLKLELESVGLAQVDVAERARAAGVHPAHASRLFRRCFGASITEFALTQAVRRALTCFADGSHCLSAVALKAGFYDQSHMTRVFRRIAGRTPGACRALLAAAS